MNKTKIGILLVVGIIILNFLPSLINDDIFDLKIKKFDLVRSQYNATLMPDIGIFEFNTQFSVENRGGFKVNYIPICGSPGDIDYSITLGDNSSGIWNFVRCNEAGSEFDRIIPPFQTFSIYLNMEFHLSIGQFLVSFAYNHLSKTNYQVIINVVSLDPFLITTDILILAID